MTAKKIVIRKGACLVCNHVDRALIEAAHVSGASLNVIAARFKVSRDCVWRHCRSSGGHISSDMRAEYLAAVPMSELAAKAAAEGVSVLEYFSIIRATLMMQFQLAASLNDKNAVAILAGRLTEVLRNIANITGEMGALASQSITINGNLNIMNSPVFANLQAGLLQALAPFPEARAAVITVLRKLDDENAPLPAATMKVINHVASAAT
jgi:hypothetical protein